MTPTLTPLARFERPDPVPHGRVTALVRLSERQLLVAHMHKVAQQTWLALRGLDPDGDRVIQTPQQGVVNRAAVLRDGRLVTASRPCGDDPGVVCFWDRTLERPERVWQLQVAHWRPAHGEATLVDRQGDLVVGYLDTGELGLRRSTTGLRSPIHDPFAASPSVCGRDALFVPDDTRLVGVRLVEGAPAQVEMAVDFAVARVLSLGRLALVAGFGEDLQVWDTHAGRLAHTLTRPDRPIVSESVASLPDGSAAFAAWDDGGCALWSLVDGRLLVELPPPPDLHPEHSTRGPLHQVGFDPLGRWALATHMDQHLHFADLRAGAWTCAWHEDAPITAFTLCPDTLDLLVGDQDGHVTWLSAISG